MTWTRCIAGSPNDVTNAQFALLWNEGTDKVYAAVTVTDMDHIFETSPWNWNSSDRLEIYMQGDPNGNGEWEWATGDAYYDKAQQYVIGPPETGTSPWSFFGNGEYIPSGSLPGSANFERALSFDGDTITYEVGVQAFIWFGGVSGATTTQAALSAGYEVGFDVIADTRYNNATYGNDFGMLSENLMTGKWHSADAFQRWLLVQTATDCGVWSYYTADFNKDCSVDLSDFQDFATDWLYCNDPVNINCDQSWRN